MSDEAIYYIISILDVFNVDFLQVNEDSINTVTKSLDSSMFVINAYTEPTFIKDGTVVPLQTLTHQECFELMRTAEWMIQQ